MSRLMHLVAASTLLVGASTISSTADAALLVSEAGTNFFGTGSAPANGATVAVTPGFDPWAGNDFWGLGSIWVSYNANTAPGGSVVANNGTSMEITQTFDTNGTAVRLYGLADDRAQIYLNENLLIDFGGANETCQNQPVGCTPANAYVSAPLLAGFAGTHTFKIFVDQTNGSAFGMQYAVAFVPLPGAALLFASALAGLGWMRRRQGGGEAVALAA